MRWEDGTLGKAKQNCLGLFGAGTILYVIFLLIGCVPLRDSPFSDSLMRDERDLNTKSMARLNEIESDGVVRIAVFSDTHENYRGLDEIVHEINATSGIDFIANLGDSTNSSYNMEYDQFLAANAGFNRPTLTVIGNHDALGAGPSLFRKAFGPANFAFESEHVRFVFWHSANIEDPEGFDPTWLIAQVETSNKPVIVFTHIPLDDPERFTGALGERLEVLLSSPKLFAVLNGHNHSYQFNKQSGTLLLQSPRVEHAQWLLFEIKVDGFHITRKDTGGAQWAAFKPSF